MKDWKFKLAIFLVILSAAVYGFHYVIFRDVHHIFIYMIGDIGFVFLEVLLITLIIHNLMERREKQSILEKLNMVIGAFFSEVGTNLLAFFSDMDPQEDRISRELIISKEWTDEAFERAKGSIKGKELEIELRRGEPEKLQKFMRNKRAFLLRLLENPNVLEHESFTQLLWAVFHLAEELAARDDIQSLPDSDIDHLNGDIERVYGRLIEEWLDYMGHLKDNYPYLFSLALRTNPFDPDAHPVIEE